MAVGLVRRWAAKAPVPVFLAAGGGAGLRPRELAADSRLRLVASPRHATVLLAAGRFPGPLGAALDRVHDQVPAPRAAVWWTADAAAAHPAGLADALVVTAADPFDAVLAAHHAALAGPGRPDVGADRPPNEFEGRGDHGQGGEGMMGGVPYGRPMAMTGDDRDGLALDQLEATMGPFLPGFSQAVQVRATLQGDVVQAAEVVVLDPGEGPDLDALDDRPVSDDRRRLRWLAGALQLGGLDALSVSAARAAATGGDAAGVVRRIRRSGLLASWSGIAPLDGVDAAGRMERVLGGEPLPTAPADAVAAALVGLDWADAVVALCSVHVEGTVLARAGSTR